MTILDETDHIPEVIDSRDVHYSAKKGSLHSLQAYIFRN